MVYSHLQVTDRPTLTTRFSHSLHLNNSVDILFSTFLLTDPEVFLMLLHNSVWCCIATVQVSLYVTGEGDFSEGGEQVAPTGGADASASLLAEWSDWGVLVGMAGGVVDRWMMDWWIAGRMIDDWWEDECRKGGKEAEQKRGGVWE